MATMLIDIDQLRKEQDVIIREWAVDFVRKSRENIKQAKAVSGGDLERSIRGQSHRSDAQLVGIAAFYFLKYGRYVDMKRLDRSRQLPVDEIKAWIEEKGVSKFTRKLSRYRGIRPSRLPKSRLINEIAWGIVKGKQKRRKHRRRRWYNKKKDYLIGQLKDDLSDLYGRFGIESAKHALENRTS